MFVLLGHFVKVEVSWYTHRLINLMFGILGAFPKGRSDVVTPPPDGFDVCVDKA